MVEKFKILFADFLRSTRKLWAEMMGALFIALAVMFSLNAVTAYRKTSGALSSWDWATAFSVFGSAFFSLVMFVFGVQSFWRARKIR